MIVETNVYYCMDYKEKRQEANLAVLSFFSPPE